MTDGFVQPRSCKLTDEEEHREPMQDNARWVEAPAFRRRLYDYPPADSKFAIISICSSSLFDRKFTAKKTSRETVLFRRKIILAEIVIATTARTTAVIQANDDARGRRTDRYFKIILIDALGEKGDRASVTATFPCRSLDGNIHYESGRLDQFTAELLSPLRRCPYESAVLPLGLLGRFVRSVLARPRVSQALWSAQVVINEPMTKTGNKPKMVAQTTKAETIKIS